MTSLTIGALAKQAGVGVETIRFYERRGLVRRPLRPNSGYRAYPLEAVARIRFVRNAQALGFSLREIKDLLSLRVTAGASCATVRSRAAAKVTDVDRRLEELGRIRTALGSLVAACTGRGALANCTILEALDFSAADGPRRRQAARKRKGIPGMKSLDIDIAGMQCAGCETTIQTVLSREPGVKSSNVSFREQAASVFFDPRKTDAAHLIEAVMKAGFKAECRQ